MNHQNTTASDESRWQVTNSDILRVEAVIKNLQFAAEKATTRESFLTELGVGPGEYNSGELTLRADAIKKLLYFFKTINLGS